MASPDEWLSKCWFLAGPTACGKTAVSVVLAKRIDAEIVALDSMTLYRRMNIGTAKPSNLERSSVPHHLIDLLDPEDDFSVADYLSRAADVCREIIDRGHTPLFVGGSGLYLRAILRGIFQGPAADPQLRERFEQAANRDGMASLLERLRQIDPITGARLHENDRRRVIRALEVYELTGQPISAKQQQRPRPLGERSQHVYWLSPPRDWLHQRINARVEQMFVDGLMEEVKQLRGGERPISQTARQALGYKEVLDWLDVHPNSKMHSDYSELITLIQTRTRQFAKRQHTWFRNLEECIPISIQGTESTDEIADLILKTGDRQICNDVNV